MRYWVYEKKDDLLPVIFLELVVTYPLRILSVYLERFHKSLAGVVEF